MKIPRKVICEFMDGDGDFTCQVDDENWGRCGDAIIDIDNGYLCLWIKEVLEWKE